MSSYAIGHLRWRYDAPAPGRCHARIPKFREEPHFNPTPPTTTFSDPIDSLAGQCGDLTFDDRTRWFTTIYASGIEAESPWKYWWVRERRASDGVAAALYEARKVSVPRDVLDTAEILIWLSDQYDALGAILILEDDGTLDVNEWGEIAFTAPWLGPWSGGLNISVQHWAHINPPILNSATVNGQHVTLTWTNQNRGRAIDSTNIYRTGWQFPRTVGPTVTGFVDSNVAPGIYTYTLKHLSAPAAPMGPPPPNSPASNGIQVTVEPPPPPLSVQISGTDYITQTGNYTWSMVRSGGWPPYSPHRWEYKPFQGGTWSTVGHTPKYTRYVSVTDPWFRLRATVWDTHGDSAQALLIVEVWNQKGAGPLAAGAVGVRLPDGTCSPRPPVGAPGRQAWLAMIMATVERIEYCRAESEQ